MGGRKKHPKDNRAIIMAAINCLFLLHIALLFFLQTFSVGQMAGE